jgi:predicted enzyme related to lactoylglutathione lyase
MTNEKPRIVGFELYFERLQVAKEFYRNVLGLSLTEDVPAHHAKFDGLPAFLCLEKKGAEPYPSADKAVVFVEVADLGAVVRKLGDRILQTGSRTPGAAPTWAVLQDPEGHSVILTQAGGESNQVRSQK